MTTLLVMVSQLKTPYHKCILTLTSLTAPHLFLLGWFKLNLILIKSSLSLCTGFNAISSNIDEVLSINPAANVFVLDFNDHHKDWPTYSGGTDRLVNCYKFSTLNELTQMVKFPTRISDCDSLSPALSSFLSIGKCCCLGFYWLSINLKTRCLFHCIVYDYCCADWNSFHDHLRDLPWEDIF